MKFQKKVTKFILNKRTVKELSLSAMKQLRGGGGNPSSDCQSTKMKIK